MFKTLNTMCSVYQQFQSHSCRATDDIKVALNSRKPTEVTTNVRTYASIDVDTIFLILNP